MRADLHMHSSHSDGEFAVKELFERVKQSKVKAWALTDHDTVKGIEEALELGNSLGIITIPGIEISCFNSRDVHILGYGIDYRSESLCKEIEKIQDARIRRSRLIIDKLKEFNINLSFDELMDVSYGRSVGRTQIAELMVRHGYVKSVKDGFDYYLGSRKKAYISAYRPTPEEGIKIIKAAGGKACLAHPNQLGFSRTNTFDFINSLKSEGLIGVEAYYYTHNKNDVEYYEKVCQDLGLICTAGSDYHGSSRKSEVGVVAKEMTEETIHFLLGE